MRAWPVSTYRSYCYEAIFWPVLQIVVQILCVIHVFVTYDRRDKSVTFIPPRASVMSLTEIARRLRRLIGQNYEAPASNFPVMAIARYLELHRDTIYAAAGGQPVSRYVQILLGRFLRRVELGEVKAQRINGRWEIVAVENPRPHLMLRVDLGLGGAGPRLSAEANQPSPSMPDFKKLLVS